MRNLQLKGYNFWGAEFHCHGGIAVVTKIALEGDQVGLSNIFIDTSDTTVTFPNCPDVATEFFQP